MTLSRKKITSLFLTGTLALTLSGCVQENSVEKNDLTEAVLGEVIDTMNAEISTLKEILESSNLINKSALSPEEIDQIAIEYFTILKEETTELYNEFKASGLTETVSEKAKAIAVTSWDFVNNKTSINGVYYSDLSENGKMVIDGIVGGVKTTVLMIAPNLGNTMADFFGPDVVEAAKNAKDSLSDLGGNALDWAYESIDEKVEGYRR